MAKTVCRGGNLEEKFVRNLVPSAAFRFRRKVKRLFKKKKVVRTRFVYLKESLREGGDI